MSSQLIPLCVRHQTEKIEVRLTEILLLQYKKWICAVENDSLPPFYPPFYAFYWQFYFTTEIENLKPFLSFSKKYYLLWACFRFLRRICYTEDSNLIK